MTEPTTFDPLAEQLLAEARERQRATLSPAERRTYWTAGAGFLVCALLLLAFGRQGQLPAPWVCCLLVGSYALASRLEFEIGSTVAIAAELVLVEMLFLLPPAQLPLWVLAGSLLSQLPDYLRRGAPPERMLIVVGSSWYAFGPALVFSWLPVEPSFRAETVGVLCLALAAQFALDVASTCLREWAALRVPPRQLLAQMPLVFSIDLALAPLGLLAAVAAVHDDRALLVPLPLLFVVSLSSRERQRRMDQALELSAAYRGTAVLLGDVVEAEDAYTGEHSRDVLELVLAVCDELEVAPAERLNAEFTALLHDVGKIKIPAEIINKPGPLDLAERRLIEQHTIEGELLLQRVGGRLAEVGALVRSCHERFDGDGYPDGLAGAEIPLVARIVSCCDAFSAMTADRSYRRALPLEAALAELEEGAGSQFDPQVVRALFQVLEARAPARHRRRLRAVPVREPARAAV
jgi:HD-GYP domain-containing protein (c-di-GMP phosphodiesterase class II)